MMSREPLATAVIVTFNSLGEIGRALTALLTAYEAGIIHCVVVDNASSDGTADFVERAHPWVKLLRHEQNVGFGRGCNAGFAHVHTPYILIQNPDAVVTLPAVRTLVGFLEKRKAAGIAAPAIVERDGNLQAAGLMTTPASLVLSAMGSRRPMKEKKPIVPDSPPFRTAWVCGAVMLVRAELFRSLGGFDRRFFLYFEETDLCRRTLEEGAEIWAVGEAVVEHAGGASTGGHTNAAEYVPYIYEHFYRSRFYYLVKHFGWVRAVVSESVSRALDRVRLWRNELTGPQPRRNAVQTRPFLKFPIFPDHMQ